jgi:hypothetical protein
LLAVEVEVARAEDEWDRLLRMHAGDGRKEEEEAEREELWVKEVDECLKDTWRAIDEEGRKNREMAEKMVGIIDQEKALAEVERKERKRVKNEERRVRKASRDGGGGVVVRRQYV